MKILYTLLSISLFHLWSYSQYTCPNEVSTNPENPSNNSLPITIDSEPNPDDRFINRFDWYRNGNIPLRNVLSTYPPNMTKLTFDSHSYYEYLSQGEELTPENGWELMLFNTGYYPDGSDNDDIGTQDLPYIVLYNKFTGILRVFGTYGVSPITNGGGTVFDGIRVNLFFNTPLNVSGNLRLRNGNDASLDKTTEVVLTQSLALHTNSPSQWFSADFQLAYDPCICFYPSDLRLRFDFIEEMELDLHGRSISIIDNIVDGNDLLTTDFLTNFEFTGSDNDNQIVMYKVMSTFVEDYIERLEKYKIDLAAVNEYNKEVERKLAILKLFKNVVVEGGTYAVSSLVGMTWFPDVVQFANELVPPIQADSAAIAGYRGSLETEAKKAIGNGIDAFLKKNFEKKQEPTKPNAPVANFTETLMKGKITNVIPIQKPAFYTPGTYGSEGTGTPVLNNPLAYPLYNNPVGTFALLNSPKIRAFKSGGEMVSEWHDADYRMGYASWRHNYQFQLDGDIYYAINDLDIIAHDIRVGFQITTIPDTALVTASNGYFIDPTNTINLTSNDVETDSYYPLFSRDGKAFNFGQNYCPNYPNQYGNYPSPSTCSYLPLDVPQMPYKKRKVVFQSDYMSIDAITPMVYSVGVVNQVDYSQQAFPIQINLWSGHDLQNFTVKMKVLVDVVYNDLDENGENITSTLMFTYDVDNIDWVTTPLSTDLQNSPVNYSAFEENLVLNTTDFDGSPVQGCKLVGTHYTCHGWDDVTIVGDLTTSGGHTVDIFGANNVFVIDESNVSPEIVLDIQTLLDYTDPMPRADAAFVKNYCKNSLGEGFPSYLANLPNKSALEEYEAFNAEKPADTKFELLSVNLYPVPTSELLNVRSSVKLSNATFTVVDLSGRLLDLPIRKLSDQDYEINVSSLAVGSYYLNITSNEGQAKKMFTVAKNN